MTSPIEKNIKKGGKGVSGKSVVNKFKYNRINLINLTKNQSENLI